MTDKSAVHAPEIVVNTLLAIQNKKILLIGDVMLDCYVDGVVNRISPEAPVPILQSSRTHEVAGGAANVAHNLANLGVITSLVGLIGDDEAGHLLQEHLLRIPHVDFDYLKVAGRKTTRKTRFRAQGQQILRVDEEVVTPLLTERENTLIARIKDQLQQQPDIIILSDYAKGCLSNAVVRWIIDAANDAQISVITDPKSSDFSKYRGSRLLTPNLKELSAAAGQSLNTLEDIISAARSQLTYAKIEAMLVTLGGDGMVYVNADDAMHLPAAAIDVFDVSGAGDTVVALMAAALAAGCPWESAMALSNRGAGIVVGKSGTATLTPGEIMAQLPSSAEIYTKDTLTDLVALRRNWAGTGDSVGITNGCFDLLHPGHLDLLQRSSETCDKLIVAVNSDRSVKALKGDTRPIQNEQRRAAILSLLPFVDAVLIFDEDTPAAIIDALLPDRLIKGGDYRAEDIVGYETVTNNGGQVDIIPLFEGHSTSRLVNS